MQASRLQSKFSKRKVRLRPCRARGSLLPAGDNQSECDIDLDQSEHVILPIETEKETKIIEDSKWNNPFYTLKPTSQFLLSDKGKSASMHYFGALFDHPIK